MSLRPLTAAEPQRLERGRPCVCLIAAGPPSVVRRALDSVLAHTEPSQPIAVIGSRAEELEHELADAAPDGGATGRVLFWLDATPGGAVDAVNRALDALAPADMALLIEPCLVPVAWLERLQAAAYSDSSAASASALAPAGTALGLEETGPGITLADFDADAERVRAHSLNLRPRLAGISGPCVYLRRSALELVGPLDASLELTPAVEVDFAARCTLRGLSHLAADDVLTAPLSPARDASPEAVALLAERYPQLAGAAQATGSPTLDRAIAAVRAPADRISVTIDARALGADLTGTQVHILELICALVKTGRVRARVVVAPDIAAPARARLEALDDATVLAVEEIGDSTRPTDIVHRPHQVFAPADMDLLVTLGRRMVVSQLDLIAYRNPGYFPDAEAWMRYQRVARQSLATADRVVVFSRHTLHDLLADELVEAGRVHVIPPGLDHAPPAATAPARLPFDVDGAPFLLCLGTDFRHKNRMFALALLGELRDVHGWDGRLVLAGTHVPQGSSRPEEAAYLAENPRLSAHVHDLGPVDQAERDWLMSNAAAVVYPSVYEGFGLIPFEAAQAGVPCVFAAQTSLSEVLPEGAASLVPWNPVLSAARMLPLLTDEGARADHVRAVREASGRLTWEAAAEAMVDVYREAAHGPSRAMMGVSRDQARRELEIDRMRAEHAARVAELELEREEARRLYWNLREQAGDGLSLVGPRGSLPEEMQRALLALSARPALSRPLYRAAAGAYRAIRGLYHRVR
ncbi:MAG TPA: glycosyltransferase [Solirubrobacteraceae bacterium]|jgi:glycosyltransferase involved in cell wall biosynthesis|nr:glycosyltransferase [Solirubrobacteraceae bacterium]